MRTRRHALVLADESARHPFRQSLPLHVLKGIEPGRLQRFAEANLGDWRDFLMAYCATFLAVLIFIS